MPRTRHTIATVVDCHPRFRIELILWALCIRKTFPASDFRRVVYFIDDAPADLTGWLEDSGFEWRVVAAPAPESPHCNKLLPFLEEQPSDYVLVTDADLYFVANPAALVAASAIQAAPNNHCNPPGHVFRNLFRNAGLAHAYKPGVSLMEGSGGHRETYLNNISAGIVCMPSATAASFAPMWLEKAQWLIENRQLLGPWAIHVDQVGFALAMAERDEQVLFFPPQTNIILHMLPSLDTAYAFHLTTGHIPQFPSRFLAKSLLSDDGVSSPMKEAIGVLNESITHAREEILRLPTTMAHIDMFLNPAWHR
jgi:hypothetical protein